MKIKLNRLSPKDKAVLADLYESDQYKIFKKHFIENGQIIIAQQGLMSPDYNSVLLNRGMAIMLKNIDDELRRLFKEENLNRS